MKVLRIVGAVLLALAVAVLGAGAYLSSTAARRLDRTFETHRVDIPVPYPLQAEELAALRAERLAAMGPDAGTADPLEGVDLAALTAERATARGKYLLATRYPCGACHGESFGGGVMIDDPAIGAWKGPNLTRGTGGVVASYTMADWDRIIRHGVKPGGRPAVMPATDFLEMSDQELSDIVHVITRAPPVNAEVPPPSLGPVGTMLMARGAIRVSAEEIADHHAGHKPLPPAPTDQLAFGKHFAQICTGCHGRDLAGGPIEGGAPDWPPASDLTPHAQALGGWTADEFIGVMRTAKRKNGMPLRVPMSEVAVAMQQTKDDELKALFAYLQSLPPVPPRP